MSPVSRPDARRLLLPDFCTPRAVLLVLAIVVLTALLLTLADAGNHDSFLGSLSRRMLFLVWTGLVGAAALCAARPVIAARSIAAGSAIVMGILLALVTVMSALAWSLLASPTLNPYGLLGPPPDEHWLFLLRNVAIGLVVGAVALRYLYVAQQWRLNVESQARARIDALQARIRPHFLFNSMNTIAALTRSNPAGAEEAVQDLSDLFRANLDERRSLVPLEEELESARAYQRIEQARLGSRLRVRWDIGALPPHALIPALTVQPLLENAIGHGIENLPEGGEVTVEGESHDGIVELRVRNPLPPSEQQTRHGHGIALENIRERLALLYGGSADISATREGGEYIVQLRFPERSAGSGT